MLPRLPIARSLVAVLLSASLASAQTPTPTSQADDLPRVFLDCQANGCDDDFLRTELTWLNFVRDRTLAIVHILATSQSTGGGGTELTVAFIGLGAMSAKVDTIVAISPQSDTFDERRNLVKRVISQGMLRFVANTPLATRLSVAYRAPAPGVVTSATRGAHDPWHQWVFRLGGNTFLNGEESRKDFSFRGFVNASRVTPSLKTELGFNTSQSKFRVEYTSDNGTRIVETFRRRNYNANSLVAKSLNDHWSVGAQANLASDLRSNLKRGTRLGPALEYDVFPYSESTRRQVILRYSVGVKSLQYDDTTVYGKLKETLPDHRLIVAAEATQPWGQLFGSVTSSQYLSDPSKYRIDGFMFANVRIVRGLSVNFDIGYTKYRDQINLAKGGATPEQVLLQLRELRTGYSYFGSVGINYTFGSVFSNVVNPRFTQGGGGFFF